MAAHAHLGPYASSTALSPQHYKLVHAVEQSHSNDETNRILGACLDKIKSSWTNRAPSTSTARHDLVLVLYARAQRVHVPGQPLVAADDELFDAAWALPVAVKLAGGGGQGSLVDRDMGYRACAELFSPLEPHPLKLLLVNTIRSDLYTPTGAHKAEARWAGALRAAANPSLASPELAPAIRERVIEFLLDPSYPDPIRRLALEALLSLLRCAHDIDSARSASLVAEARDVVLSLVLPPPPSLSSSGRSRPRSSSRHAPLSLSLLAALASALSPSSPLYPVLSEARQRVQLLVELCQRVLAASEGDDARRTRFKGVKGMWATERALKALRDELAQGEGKGEELDAQLEEEVAALVWEVVGKMLETANEASDGVTLTALSLVPLLSAEAVKTPKDASTLKLLLARLDTHLTSPSVPAAQLFALRALACLPPSTWATVPADDAKGKGKARATSPPAAASPSTAVHPWGQDAWRAILSGLDHPDSAAIRRATLALLRRVDGKLVEMQYERLMGTLAVPTSTPGDTAESSERSTSSVTSGRRGGKHVSRVLSRVLEVLPFLDPAPPPPSPPSSLPHAPRLLALLSRPELALAPTSVPPALVVPVLTAFEHAATEVQNEFARGVLRGGGRAWWGSVVAGLWVAGSVQALGEGEAGEAVELLGGWLALDDRSNADLVTLLQEPFLFALLRLLALHPSLPTPPSFSDDVARASIASVSPETSRLFALLQQCVTPSPSPADEHVRATLQHVGAHTRSSQLGDFGVALLSALGVPATPGAQSPSPVPSRLHHPPPPPPPASAPLRYSYSPPRSSSPSASSPFPSAAPHPSRSTAALARERADLLRERSERGGTGARAGERVESVRTPRMRVGELGDEEAEEGGGAGVGRTEGERASQGGEEEVGETGETSGEPPADLLIELESLDPFRTA